MLTEDQKQQTAAGATSLDMTGHSTKRDQLVRALARPAGNDLRTPLVALQQQIKKCFLPGAQPIAPQTWMDNLGTSLFAAACRQTTAVPRPPHYEVSYPPQSSSGKSAGTVGLFACPAHRLFEVVTFQRMVSDEEIDKTPKAFLTTALTKTQGAVHEQASTVARLRSSNAINKGPSASSLQTAFRNAKARASGGDAKCGLIMVLLVDVHMLEMIKKGKAHDYATFSRSFVMGIGPEGVIIWQSWGHGADVGLGGWISKDCARIRTWDEAGQFVDSFEKFVAYKVSSSSSFVDSNQGVC